MREIELKSIEEYDEKNLPSDEDFIKEMKNRYPHQYMQTLQELRELYDIGEDKSEEYVCEVCDLSEIVEVFDDLFDEELIENYYVADSVGTDRGDWNLIVENGYIFISN